MLERFKSRRQPTPQKPESAAPSEHSQIARRDLMVGIAALAVTAKLPSASSLFESSRHTSEPEAPVADNALTIDASKYEAATADVVGEPEHKGRLSALGYAVIAEQMASFGQIIKKGHFTPFTSARSIANLYSTTEILKRAGNEEDRHMAAEMRLEFAGSGGLNLGLAVALPYITNMTKYMRVVAGELVTGLPAEAADSTHNPSFISELLRPHDISRERQDKLNAIFAPTEEADPEEDQKDVSLTDITTPVIDQLIHRFHEEGNFETKTKEAAALIEVVLENKLKQLIGRGCALIDVVAPLGTTYLSTQIGNELANEVLEYKYRLEYAREIGRHAGDLAVLDTTSPFELEPELDTVAPPSNLQEGLHVLEHKALYNADAAVNSIRGLFGARIARGANGSGIMLAGDPPLPFAYAEASKRGMLPKLLAKTVQWGAVDTIANGIVTSAQLAHRIIDKSDNDTFADDVHDRFGTVHAYLSGATIMTNKVTSAVRDLRPTLRKINNGTAIQLETISTDISQMPEEDITPQEYSRHIEEFLDSIKNGNDPNVVMPILKIMRQSAIGGYNSIKDALLINAQTIGTEEGRKQLIDRYLKLEPPAHEQHHQTPDDLILQGEAVSYTEMASRLESWTPRDQLRYMRSIMYRYLSPGDFAGDSALGGVFAEDVLSDHPHIEEYTSTIYDTAAQFVSLLRGHLDTEDTPITARNLAPEIKEVFNQFAQSAQVGEFLKQKPPIAEDKLADMARSQAGYDLPYGELKQWSENAQEVFFALTTQLPHVGAIVETAKLLLEGFDSALNRMGADTKTKAALKLTLNSLLVMGVSSVADNVAAFLFGLKTGELIIDDVAAEDDSLSEEDVNELKFTAMMTALSTAIHAGQNLLPGNGPNFSAARAEPDVGKLIAIGNDAARIGHVDQVAHQLPLIDAQSATEDEKAQMKQAASMLRTRKDGGFPNAVRIHKIPEWDALKYQEVLAEYGLHMSPERIERFIMQHPEDDVILIARPARLEDGRVNTHPVSLGLKESVQTTRHYPIQGLAAPAAWLGHIMKEVTTL